MPEDKEYSLLGFFEVEWSAQGNNWIDRFSAALAQGGSGVQHRGHKFDVTTQPYIAIHVGVAESAELHDVLIAPMKGAIAVVIDPDIAQPAGFVDVITEAAKLATDWLLQEGPVHVWSAVIGPPPEGTSSSVPTLPEKTRIGSLILQPSEHLLVEASRNLQGPSLWSYQLHSSVPILVQGKNRGYSWSEAGASAARDLNRICALLSVAWDTCLVVRESPPDLGHGQLIRGSAGL